MRHDASRVEPAHERQRTALERARTRRADGEPTLVERIGALTLAAAALGLLAAAPQALLALLVAAAGFVATVGLGLAATAPALYALAWAADLERPATIDVDRLPGRPPAVDDR